jgi:hypothetical protein
VSDSADPDRPARRPARRRRAARGRRGRPDQAPEGLRDEDLDLARDDDWPYADMDGNEEELRPGGAKRWNGRRI